MTPDDTGLRAFGAEIQHFIDGRDLSRERTYELFREVLLGEQPDLQQGALLAALVAKGETPEEIAGAWQAIVELDTVPATVSAARPPRGGIVSWIPCDRYHARVAALALRPLASMPPGRPPGPLITQNPSPPIEFMWG